MSLTKPMLAAAAILAGIGPAEPRTSSSAFEPPHDRTTVGVRLSNFSEFALSPGVNRIDNLMNDGREGLIVRGWRDNGNAHGFDVFMALAPAAAGGSDYNVVTFDDGEDDTATSISDAPHTGEDVVRSVRFGRALLDGWRETLTIVAQRQIVPPHPYPDPARTRIRVLALRHRGDDPLGPLDYFETRADFLATRLYCNADAALHIELGIPLPADYAGPNPTDGCL